MLTHGMRTAAVIHANGNMDFKIDWTDQRAGLASRDRPTTSEVSYDRLTDPTELLVARTNLDWRDVENGGSCSIFSQTIPIEDRFDFTRLADLIYIGIEENMLRLFVLLLLQLFYDKVNENFPGSQSYLQYSSNR